MITSYFTEQEKEYWEKDDVDSVAISFTNRFLTFYTTKESELPFVVHAFDNQKKFFEVVCSFHYKSLRQFAYNNVIYKKIDSSFTRFQKSFTNSIIDNIESISLDISEIIIFQSGDIIILRKPLIETTNKDNQWHNINGEAILWPDGSKEYFLYGIKVTCAFFQKLYTKQYSFKDFINDRNEERKSISLRYFEEKFGTEYVFNFLRQHLQEVDTYVDKKDKKYLQGTTQGMNVGVYTLFKGSISASIQLAFVRCYCPSTDRMFFLGVHPNETNAKDAIASLYRIPRTLANEIKYIQRQGERFTTVFTSRGNELIKKINETHFQDLTSISGDEYFNKMYYEF